MTSQSLKNASVILELYDIIGVNVFSPGPNDLVGGLDLLRNFSPTNMAIVSSNLYSTVSEKPVFNTFKQVQLGSSKIEILGLTGISQQNSNEYYLKDTNSVLKNILGKHKDSTDFFILLSSLPLSENKAIADSFPDISIIVSADNRLTSISPLKQGNTLIVQTVNRGKYLGAIDVDPGLNPAWGKDYKPILQSKSRALSALEYQLRLKQHSKTDKDISTLQDRIETAKTELTELEQSKEENDKAYSHYETKNYKLGNAIVSDEKIEILIESLLNQ